MNEKIDLGKEQAEHFGEWLNEAFETMVTFSLEEKFNRYPLEEKLQLERVLEALTIFFDMWESGQIMLSSKRRNDD